MEDVDVIKRRLKGSIILIFAIVFFCILTLIILNKFIIVKEYYKASDFNIKTIYSKVDYNGNGIDDYSDLLLGAKKQVNKKATASSFIIKSFANAGYDLQEMIEEIDEEDKTLAIKDFWKNNITKIDAGMKKIDKYQPGDLVVYEDGIAILSDKRNENGLNFLIYVKDGKVVEEDSIARVKIIAHYRFDASLIKDEILK